MTTTNLIARPIGPRQTRVLNALRTRGEWWDSPACGWSFGSPSETRYVLESLMLRGLVTRGDDDRYRPA